MGRERTLVSPPLVQGAWFLSPLFADDLDQHAFAATAVELAIKNLLPRAEVEPAVRDRDHDFTPHDLALHMRIGIVLASPVVTIARDWFVRR